MDLCLELGAEDIVVQLRHENLRIPLFVLGDGQGVHHIVAQLPEGAYHRTVADDLRRPARVEIGHIALFIGKFQVAVSRQCLQGLLHGKEVLLRPAGAQTQGLHLPGRLGQGQAHRQVYIGQLEEPHALMAVLDVVLNGPDHGGSQEGPHDAQVLRDGVQNLHRLPLLCFLRNQELVEFRPGGHGDSLDLEIALGAKERFYGQFLPLCRVQAAVGDQSFPQEGGDYLVVAVLPDHFLGDVLIRLDVLPVAGHGQGQYAAFALHAEVQGPEDPHHLLLRHLYAQHVVHPSRLYPDDPPLGGRTGADVEVGGADLRHPQGLNQVQGTGHAAFHGILIDAFLVPGRGVGVEPQPPGGLADAVLAELGGLEEHLLCVLRNLAVLAPHDAGQAYGLLLIADQQIARIQHALLPVQGHQLLSLGRKADYDGRALQGVQVEGMHGLADFHQHVVGDVHHGADGIVAHGDEPALHPQGRLLVLHVVYIMAQVPGAHVLVDHGHANVPVHGAVTGVAHVGGLHFLPQEGRHLPGDAQHGLAVGPVGRNRNIEHIILQAQVGLNVLSHGRVVGQDHDAVHVRPRIPFLVQAQLLPGTEHAVGHHVLHLPGGDLQAARQLGPHQAGGNLCPLEHIVRAGENQVVVALLAAVDMTDIKVRPFVFFYGGDLAHVNLLDVFAQVGDLLHLQSGGEQLLLQLLGGHVYVYIFL